MNEHDVHDGIQGNRKRKRLGRGVGSGLGKTSGRGRDGHKSRSGYSRHPIFNGGDLPMVRRIPKRGFHNRFASTVFAINVGEVNDAFDGSQEINADLIRKSGLVKVVSDEIKILGEGEVNKKLNLVVTQISASAKEKVEKAGGTVKVVRARKSIRQRILAKKAAEAAKA
jgi:large subunit ribosomal protein L15